MKKTTVKTNKSIKSVSGTVSIGSPPINNNQAYYPTLHIYPGDPPLREEDIEYFNKTIDLITKMMNKMGFTVNSYSTTHSSTNIIYNISGEFLGKPKDADDFVTLARRAILKGAINENSDKDSK